MKKCKLCGNSFKTKVVVDGKKRNFQRRKYCLTCSPFGSGNTIKLSRYGETVNSLDVTKTNERLYQKRRRENRNYREYQRERRRERKKKLVGLKGGQCERCGYDECIASLDFHHENPSNKKAGVSELNLLSRWETLVEEVKKCNLLCKNCHNRHHFLNDEKIMAT